MCPMRLFHEWTCTSWSEFTLKDPLLENKQSNNTHLISRLQSRILGIKIPFWTPLNRSTSLTDAAIALISCSVPVKPCCLHCVAEWFAEVTWTGFLEETSDEFETKPSLTSRWDTNLQSLQWGYNASGSSVLFCIPPSYLLGIHCWSIHLNDLVTI